MLNSRVSSGLRDLRDSVVEDEHKVVSKYSRLHYVHVVKARVQMCHYVYFE